MRGLLKKYILQSLDRANGLPFVESNLAQAVKLMARPAIPTSADVALALAECESEGYVSGITDEFTHEKTWTLTEKGKHRVANL